MPQKTSCQNSWSAGSRPAIGSSERGRLAGEQIEHPQVDLLLNVGEFFRVRAAHGRLAGLGGGDGHDLLQLVVPVGRQRHVTRAVPAGQRVDRSQQSARQAGQGDCCLSGGTVVVAAGAAGVVEPVAETCDARAPFAPESDAATTCPSGTSTGGLSFTGCSTSNPLVCGGAAAVVVAAARPTPASSGAAPPT